MKRLFCLIALILLTLSYQMLLAEGLDDLAELSDDSSEQIEAGEEMDDLSAEENAMEEESEMDDLSAEEEEVEEESKISISFGGYLKAVGYWNEERYSDELWKGKYLPLSTAPPSGNPIPKDQKINGFNNIGTRMQLKVEGFLGDDARLFSAFNLNFNEAESLHDSTLHSDNSSSTGGELRMVEGFIEIYNGSRTWKIGPQIVTWSFLEGLEVPTDRVNARDYSYKSTEYEDSKLASYGVLLTQSIFDSAFEIMYIPVAKHNVSMEFQEYFYVDGEKEQEKRPNNGKWASRFTSSLGNLDYSLNYVEGPGRTADLVPTTIVWATPTTAVLATTQKTYTKVRSPGLDLQYNFGNWLAKLSYVQYMTEDTDGDDPFIKNNWSKYVIGGEFTMFGQTVNLYAGQEKIENYKEVGSEAATNFLLGQLREQTDFVSGHINAGFLTGDALNVVIMAAGYWDKDSEPVQSNIRATFKYKIANGLEVLFSPTYMDLLDNVFVDYQTEVKYSF